MDIVRTIGELREAIKDFPDQMGLDFVASIFARYERTGASGIVDMKTRLGDAVFQVYLDRRPLCEHRVVISPEIGSLQEIQIHA